uniref:C2 NT-type domain-containing protein n=1 Tax=Davidia involucrata TaxID=16924 RepID=A0A5B7BPX8_DAVIN
MVLGLRTKNRKSALVQVDYLIHVQEIKPWPPSQSLRTLRSVLIQWEHGDRSSGSTNPVVPSLGSGIGDGKIEFYESFRLPVTLLREMSVKGVDDDTFQKNCIEFNLYEPRRDKTVKGQLLGTAVIDLADYGILKEGLSISAPMNCKRNFRNTAQPILFIKIQPVENGRTSSSLRGSLSKEASMERNCTESVSALMNEEYAEEAEIASYTDDDVSSHSSLAVSSSTFESNGVLPSQNEENASEAMEDSPGELKEEHVIASRQGLAKSDTKPVIELHESLKGSSSCSSSTDLSSDLDNPVNGHATSSNFPEPSLTSISKKMVAHSVRSSSSSIAYEGMEEELNTGIKSNDHDDLAWETDETVANGKIETRGNDQASTKESLSNGPLAKVISLDTDPLMNDKLGFANSLESQVNGEDDEKAWSPNVKGMYDAASADVILNGSTEDNRRKHQENGQTKQFLEEKKHSIENEPLYRFPQDDTEKQVSSESDAPSFNRENLGVKNNVLSSDRLKHVKSVRSPMDSGRSNESVKINQFVEKVKDVSVPGDAQIGDRSFMSNERKDAKVYTEETRDINSDSKIQQLEHRVKMLEGELREAAAIEVGLYSVVAEHGSSINKVHAPARRLSRMYLHACKENSQSRGATAARSAVSGLVLVAKACGNDVPRLTFWLSNSVVLRAIISQASVGQQLPLSAGPFIERTGGRKGNNQKSSPLKWKESSPSKETRGALYESFGDWEDPCTFTSALEKIEAWIFSRIIESVWWQTLTPHMQSEAAKAINRCMASNSNKIYRRTCSSGDQEQINFSLELWKKAFKDACERICPVRAGGHECGCLPLLARLIMEQCVARLDVAMFNAILRESDDEIPTDPVSDPISDAKVLPIPAGKASFGDGAQLKNVIGNWSRWLTDLFGIDNDDSLEDENDHDNDDNETKEYDMSFKPFHLLNAWSDLMMLPKDMLLSRSIRKEVCPTFGAPLIRRILNNFVPDEFCPDPIPDVLLEALDSEDSLEAGEASVTNVPCTAAPIVYLAPSAASVAGIIGEIGSQSHLRRNGSLVLRKSYTSDDEIDELDSPLTSIIDGFRASPTPAKPYWISKENGSRNAVRYQLLREVWMNSE